MSISTVTSESLQLKLRQLLPSQQGFGTDLSASDTIIPIIDLTEAAEGSVLPANLQNALAFGSQTTFEAANATVVIANTPGFYRIIGVSTQLNKTTGGVESSFSLTDGSTTKIIWSQKTIANISAYTSQDFDFFVFLATGESVQATTNGSSTIMKGSSRQVADVNGDLVNPSGFTAQ
jgi:hypothetical protein